MNIKIVAVGKLKEDYLRAAIQEYSKRLNRFIKLTIVEVPEYKLSDKASQKEEDRSKNIEASAIVSKIKDNECVIGLSPNGEEISSEEFATLIKRKSIAGVSNITFVIGGSLGLGEAVLTRADYMISFSRLTFPHQLFRVLVLEQIYRGFKINANETYHK